MISPQENEKNLRVFSTLAQKTDIVLYQELCRAAFEIQRDDEYAEDCLLGPAMEAVLRRVTSPHGTIRKHHEDH